MSEKTGANKVPSFYGDPKLNPHVKWVVEDGASMIAPKSTEDYPEGTAPENPQLAAMEYVAKDRGTDHLFVGGTAEFGKEREIAVDELIGGTAVEASIDMGVSHSSDDIDPTVGRPDDDFGLLIASRPGSGSI